MFFAMPAKQINQLKKSKDLSKSKWSKDTTHDGYHVRAGQTLFLRENLLLGRMVGHCETVEGVDKDGNVFSAYAASAWRGKPIPLEDCVTE